MFTFLSSIRLSGKSGNNTRLEYKTDRKVPNKVEVKNRELIYQATKSETVYSLEMCTVLV